MVVQNQQQPQLEPVNIEDPEDEILEPLGTEELEDGSVEVTLGDPAELELYTQQALDGDPETAHYANLVDHMDEKHLKRIALDALDNFAEDKAGHGQEY